MPVVEFLDNDDGQVVCCERTLAITVEGIEGHGKVYRKAMMHGESFRWTLGQVVPYFEDIVVSKDGLADGLMKVLDEDDEEDGNASWYGQPMERAAIASSWVEVSSARVVAELQDRLLIPTTFVTTYRCLHSDGVVKKKAQWYYFI